MTPSTGWSSSRSACSSAAAIHVAARYVVYRDTPRGLTLERARHASPTPETPAPGLDHRRNLGTWEQRSVPLRISPPYDRRIARFDRYFRVEMAALGADRMQADAAVLAALRRNRSTTPTPAG